MNTQLEHTLFALHLLCMHGFLTIFRHSNQALSISASGPSSGSVCAHSCTLTHW